MNNAAITIVALIIAYLIGSFPSAYIIGKMRKGVDIRQVGSHNMGAMNTFYKVGFGWGILVLFLDISKGTLAVAAAWQLVKINDIQLAYYVQLGAGLAVVLGHSYPAFLKLKGGKGGATCIGVLAYLFPWGIPVYPALFGISLAITRFPTLSYSIAFLCFPFLAAFLSDPNYSKVAYITFSVVLLLVPILRYLPRVRQMHAGAGGSWKHVAMRKNLKDRL
jgi:acyl phosphate:glycerol-3-phosphate acyltransferase